ncbi:unnamed protein product, partial [marine sediment metagenome]
NCIIFPPAMIDAGIRHNPANKSEDATTTLLV